MMCKKYYAVAMKNKEYSIKTGIFEHNFNIKLLFNEQPFGVHCLFIPRMQFSQKKILFGNFLNPSLKFSDYAIYYSKNGSELLTYRILNYFLKNNSFIKNYTTSYLKKNDIYAYEYNLKNDLNDIIKASSKIDLLISKDFKEIDNNNIFSLRSGLYLSQNITIENAKNISVESIDSNLNVSVYAQNIFYKDLLIYFNRTLYKLIPLLYSLKFINVFSKLSISKTKLLNLNNHYRVCNGRYNVIDNKFLYNYLNNYVYTMYSLDKFYSYFFKNYWPLAIHHALWIYQFHKFKLFKFMKIYPLIWNSDMLIKDNHISIKKKNKKKKNIYTYYNKNMYEILLNNHIIIQNKKNNFFILEPVNDVENHRDINLLNINNNYIFTNSFQVYNINNVLNFYNFSESFDKQIVNLDNIIKILYSYYIVLYNIAVAILICIYKILYIFSKSIIFNYQIHDISLSAIHTELLIKKMINNGFIEKTKNTFLIPFEYIKLINYKIICKSILKYLKIKSKMLNNKAQIYQIPVFYPIIYYFEDSLNSNNSFLLKSSYSNTSKVLAESAIYGAKDWLSDIFQQIAVRNLITLGSNFLNFKYNLDQIYIQNYI